jgi:Domain of unknown function (DUF397)
MPAWQSRYSTLIWRKSKASGGQGECVEIARIEQSVLVRDSRDPLGTVLAFSSGQWSVFLRGLGRDNRRP